jgi:hypothetical protein
MILPLNPSGSFIFRNIESFSFRPIKDLSGNPQRFGSRNKTA